MRLAVGAGVETIKLHWILQQSDHESVTAATYSIKFPSAAKPQPKGRKNLTTKGTEITK
jgi:hypothetical protein